MSNNTQNISKFRKGKGGLTFQDFGIGVSGFQNDQQHTITFSKKSSEKGRVGPAFQDFGVRNLRVPVSKHSTYKNSRN
jgi:hypothetical protein